MCEFDVVIIGGGPAGGHCARLLAKSNYKVLLVERFLNFEHNSFSSAGTVFETLHRFNLPKTVIGSFWDKLAIITSNQTGAWQANQPQGVVLDFSKLRQFLADEVVSHHGSVWMGHRYLSHCQQENQLLVELKNKSTAKNVTVSTKVLVDATGVTRAVMYPQLHNRTDLITAIGLEYLISVDSATYHRYSNSLTFFVGSKFIPKGYAWVFPMQNNLLKVGAGLAKEKHPLINDNEIKPLKYYVDLLIKTQLKPAQHTIQDIHGGVISYSSGLKDCYAKKNIIAIGDSVSTLNPLGAEGIRHGMLSSEIANRYIQELLQGKRVDFSGYQTEMHQVFLDKWNWSEKLARKKYLADPDGLIDRVVHYFNQMSLEEIVDILFFYRFETIYKNFWHYFWQRCQFLIFNQLTKLKKTIALLIGKTNLIRKDFRFKP